MLVLKGDGKRREKIHELLTVRNGKNFGAAVRRNSQSNGFGGGEEGELGSCRVAGALDEERYIVNEGGGNASTNGDDEENNGVKTHSPQEGAGRAPHANAALQKAGSPHLSGNDGSNGASHDKEAQYVACPPGKSPAPQDLVEPAVSNTFKGFFLVSDDHHVHVVFVRVVGTAGP